MEKRILLIKKTFFFSFCVLCKKPQLVEAYNYPSETHKIQTEDGYILETHRIAAPGKQPVILMHGLLDSSATWVMLGPDKGLGVFSRVLFCEFCDAKNKSFFPFVLKNSFCRRLYFIRFGI